MNAEDITGDMPDFMLAMKLSELAFDQFTDQWCQPTALDEHAHELIQQMHQVGLLDMAMALHEGVQIVLYRLAQE